ncbi:MAG: hypothetical protein QF681_16895 [Vicinamibacterales bacterium]|nr:hypothetical protein [Vicinamibacterales bacterium]
MPTNKRPLADFVSLGQEILRCDWTAHYGKDASRVAPSPPALAYAQPGFLGGDYTGLVVVGQNPGVGADAFWEKRHRVWDPLLRAWRDEGTVSAYADFHRTWQTGDLPYWTVWWKWVEPVLSRISLNENHVAYLNLVKNQTSENRPPTVGMYDADWMFTRRQLDVLNPKVVIAGGLAVERQIRKHWPDAPFRLVSQNRIRSQSEGDAQRQAAGIAAEVAAALGL